MVHHPVPMLEVLQKLTENAIYCTTGSEKADHLLGGGIRSGDITEIYGPENSGKSQMCFTIAVDQILKGNQVLFVDSEAKYCAERVTAILRRRAGVKANLRPIMKLLHVSHIFELNDLFDLLHHLICESEKKTCKYSVLILDSVTAVVTPHLLRIQDEKGGDKDQFALVEELMRMFHFLLQYRPGLAIIATSTREKWFKRWHQSVRLSLRLTVKHSLREKAATSQSADQEEQRDDADSVCFVTVVRQLEVIRRNAICHLKSPADTRFEVVITDAGLTDYSSPQKNVATCSNSKSG